MKKVIGTERLPIKMWLDDCEEGALEQAKNLANLPFAFRHIALMPDCHQGYGMPIGGVLATKGVVVPNAVGVDIGCGMRAMRTNLQHIEKSVLERVVAGIREVVPVGFKRQAEPQDIPFVLSGTVCEEELDNARTSLGTLGGGNHFIEIQKGSDGLIWVMIHSGSRNLGKKVADHYNNLAVDLNERYFSSVSSDKELAFLHLSTDEAFHYLQDMEACVSFAEANRALMAQRIVGVLETEVSGLSVSSTHDVPHNYVTVENHFGENVWVHRKGATRARSGELGIIPGSQGSHSYIVSGLGNPESFMSCSHGAGRRMGRKQAQRELSLGDEIEALNAMGVIHSIETVEDLDEAPSAYKNISEVMANQSDLVKIEVELTPLAVIKG